MLESVGYFADNFGLFASLGSVSGYASERLCFLAEKISVPSRSGLSHKYPWQAAFIRCILLFSVKIGYHDVRKIVRGTLRFLFCVCVRTDFKQH